MAWPPVIGIECVGKIADPSDSDLQIGRTVATAMGGSERSQNGLFDVRCSRHADVDHLNNLGCIRHLARA